MNDVPANRPKGNTLEELRQQNRFSDYLFVAWGIIELLASDSLLQVYQLSSQDLRADPLLQFSIERKLNFFVRIGMLKKDERNKVQEFQVRRNKLFHAHGVLIPNLPDSEKEELMDLGRDAVDAIYSLKERVVSQYGQSIRRLVTEEDVVED